MKRELQPSRQGEELVAQYKAAIETMYLDFNAKGLLGDHPIAIPILENSTQGGVMGQISGSIFSLRGNFYGETGDQPAFTFLWQTNTLRPAMMMSRIPADKIVMEIQEDPDLPSTVNFALNIDHYLKLNTTPLEQGNTQNALTVVKYSHPNEYLTQDGLKLAQMKLTKEDYEKIRTHDLK